MWVNYKAGGKKLYVKQYLPDINGNSHSNASFKVVKKEKKEKKASSSENMSSSGNKCHKLRFFWDYHENKKQLPGLQIFKLIRKY